LALSPTPIAPLFELGIPAATVVVTGCSVGVAAMVLVLVDPPKPGVNGGFPMGVVGAGLFGLDGVGFAAGAGVVAGGGGGLAGGGAGAGGIGVLSGIPFLLQLLTKSVTNQPNRTSHYKYCIVPLGELTPTPIGK